MKGSSLAIWAVLLAAGAVFGQMTPAGGQGSAAAPGSVPISGTLLGHDGRPMIKGVAELMRSESRQPDSRVQVGPDGRFRVVAPGTGLYLLRLSGVYHKSALMPLILREGDSVQVEVRLPSYKMRPDLDHVGVIGDFNRFAVSNQLPMSKLPDGTFRVEVKAVRDSVAYELVGAEVDGRGIPGTQASSFVFDGAGDFLAVIPAPDSSVVLTFDPRKLDRSTDPLKVDLSPPHEGLNKYRELFAQGKRLFSLYQMNYVYHEQLSEAKDTGQTDAIARLQRGSDSLAAEVKKADADDLLSRAKKSDDPLERELLLLTRLRLEGFNPEGPSESLMKTITQGVSPLSPWWSLDQDMILQDILTEGRRAFPSDYLREVQEKHPDSWVRASALLCTLYRDNREKKKEDALAVYDRLNKEFSGSQATAYAGALFNPNLKIREGEKVPDFSFVSLDKPGTRYTNSDFRGKTYLIDFWATWCGPCVAEMPQLHSVYEKYKGKGLEILSLSLDRQADKVAAFRGGQWKMPWKNGFMEGGADSPMGAAFEISTIPKPVLVDPEGNILATGMKLRGRQLQKTLEKVFGH